MQEAKSSKVWKNVCIGIDGSPGSMRAVDYVGGVLAKVKGVAVTLICVISKGRGQGEQSAAPEENRFFAAAERILHKHGIGSGQINRVPCVGESIADCILKIADNTGSGTIVLGRRGSSTVKELLLGSVPEQVIRGSRGKAIWIVD